MASRFWTKNSPSNQDLPCMILKTRFPSLNVGLDIKTLMIALNCKFWKLSVNSLSCSSAHFLLLLPVFPLPLATLLTIVLYSSTLYSVIKIKRNMLQWVTFYGKSWSIIIDVRKSCCSIGLWFLEARKSPGIVQVVYKSLRA